MLKAYYKYFFAFVVCLTSLSADVLGQCLAINVTQTDVNCFGGNDGQIIVTVTAGVAPFTYELYYDDAGLTLLGTVVASPATSVTFRTGNGTLTEPGAEGFGIPANAGSSQYRVIVRASGPGTIVCERKTGFAIIGQPASALNAVTSSIDPDCDPLVGTGIGAIDITPSGGTAPYTFLWSDGATVEDRTNVDAGSYSVTVTDANLCTFLLNATVPVVTQANAGAAQNVCADNTVLAGNAPGVGEIGTWTVISGSGVFTNANSPTTSVGSLGFGANTFEWRITDAPPITCTGTTSTVTITRSSPASVDAGPPQTICTGSTVTLAGTFGGSATSATWSRPVSADGTFNNVNLPGAIYTPGPNDIAAGSVVLTYTTNDPLGPCPAVSDVVTITINTTAIVDAGPPQTICTGSTVTLAGTFGGSATGVSWSKPVTADGTFSNITDPNAIYTPGPNDITNGSVVLTLDTDDPAGPCLPATDNVTITINPVPTVDAGLPQTICSSISTPLAGSSVGGAATTGAWSIVTQPVGGDGVLSSILQTATPSTITFTATIAGSYTLRLTTNDPTGPCTPATDDVVVTVDPGAIATAGADNSLCSGASTPLAGSSVGGSATTGAWSIVTQPVGGDGVLSSLLQTATPSIVTFGATVVGSYTLRLTTNDPTGPCLPDTDDVIIVVNPQAIATASPDNSICSSTPTPLAGSSVSGSATTGAWSIITQPVGGDGVLSSLLQTATPSTVTFSATIAGSYTLRLTTNDPAGPCAPATDDVVITVDPGAIATAGADNSLCSGATTPLAGSSVGGSATTGAWSIVTQPVGGDGVLSSLLQTATPSTVTFSATIAGSYTLRLTTNDPAGLCPVATDDVIIVVSPEAVATAAPDNSICSSTPTPLAGSSVSGSATTGAWSIITQPVGGDGILSSLLQTATPSTVTFSATVVGSYTLRLTTNDPAGPCAPATDDVVITVDPGAIATAGGDNSICSGAITPLAGSSVSGSATTGAWSIVTQPVGGDGVLSSLLQTATPSTVTFSATIVGSYTLRLTTNDPAGLCPAATDDVIIVVSPEAIATAAPDNSICSSTPTPLAGSSVSGSATTGAWSIITQPVGGDGVLSSILQTATPSTVTFSATVVGSYTLRLTTNDPAGPCAPATDDVVITVDPGAIATAGADNSICSGASTPLAGSSVGGSATTGAWSIVTQPVGGDGVLSSLLQTATPSTVTFTATVPGSYTLRLTTNDPTGSCTPATDDILITVNPGAIASAGPDNSMCAGASMPLAGSSVSGSATTGAWSIVTQPVGGDGVLSSLLQTATPSTVTFDATVVGSYTLRLTTDDPAGSCTPATDDVVITVGSGAIAAAGADNSICSSTPTPLAGSSVSGSATTGAWSIITQPVGGDGVLSSVLQTATPSTVTFSATVVGSYTLRLTTDDPAGSCTPATDDVVITVDPGAIATAGADNSICSSTPTPLAGSSVSGSATTGAWSIITQPVGGDGVLSSVLQTATPSTVTFDATVVGSYTLRLTTNDPAGSCTPATDDVVITVDPGAIAAAGADNSICSGGITPLTGSSVSGSATTGAWSIITQPVGGDGVLSSVLQTATPSTVTFDATVVGSYTLRLTTDDPAGSCTPATDDVVITVGSGAIAAAGTDNSICTSTPTPLAGSSVSGSATTGAWSIVTQPVGGDGVLSSVLQTATPSTVTFSATVVGAYTLRLTTDDPAGSCTPATDDVVITVDPGAIATAGADNPICSGDITPLTGSSVGGSATTGAWSIVTQPVGGDGVLSSVLQTTTPSNITFTATVAGSYTLRLTTDDPAGLCSPATDDVVILIEGAPTTAVAGGDQTVCGPATLAGNAPVVGTGVWTVISGGAGASFTDANNPTTVFSGTGGVTYTIRWTISNGSCTDSFDETDITFDINTPTTSNAGPDQSVCSTNATLAGNTPVVGIGGWSVVTGTGGSFADASDPLTVFTGTAGVTYTLRWTITNGACTPSNDDVLIAFDLPATTSAAGADQTVCSTTATLAGNTPAIGIGGWSVVTGAGGSFADVSDPLTVFTGTAGVTYTLAWTISNSCGNSVDDVVIELEGTPTPAAAGGDQTVCGPATLAGNTPVVGTGVWTVVSGGAGGSFTDATNPTTAFSGTGGVTYTIRWTISNGSCTDSFDETDITFDINTPTTSNAGPDQSVCSTNATLAGNAAVVGIGGWSVVTGTGGSFADVSDPLTVFTGTAGVTYTLRWTITNGACTPSTDDVLIAFDLPATTAAAGADQTVCSTTATLAGNTPTSGTGAWSVVTGAGGSFADASDPLTVFTGTAGVTYTLAWTISNSCGNNADQVTIKLDVAPTISNAGPDQVLCSVFTTNLNANVPVTGVGVWTIVTGTGGAVIAPSNPTSQFVGSAGNSYTLRWIITNGSCAPSTDDVVVNFAASPAVTSPVTVCVNTAAPALTATASGATGFNWYLGTGVTRTFLATTATGSFTSGAELNLTVPGSVTYEVTAVYGCGESLGSPIVVNVSNTGACAGGGSNCFAFAASDPVIETRPTCANQNDGQLIFGIKGGTGTYVITLYDSVSVPIFTQAKIGSSAAPITFTNLSPSLTYFYKIDDGTNTCTLPYSLPVQTTVTASATSFTDAQCFGEATGTAIINATGSQTGQYFYSTDNGVNWTLFTPGNVVSDLPPNGTYNILVGESTTDACVAAVSVTINNAHPDLQIGTTITDATCNNNDGRIVITPPTAPFIGGGGPYQYALTDGVTPPIFQSGLTFDNLAGGVYSILVQDGLGCVKTFTPVNVTFPGFVNFTVTNSDADCSNNGISGSITVDITDIGGVYKVALSTDQFNEPDDADYIDYSEPFITFPPVVRGTYFVYVQSQTASCPTRSAAINIGGSYAVNFDIVPVCSDNKVSIILSNITGEPNVPFSIQIFDKLDPLTPIEDIPVSSIPVTGGVRLDYDDYTFLQIPNKEYLIQINQVQSTFCAFLSPLENHITTRSLFARVRPRVSAEDGESYPDEFTGKLGVIDFDGGIIPYEIKIEMDSASVAGQSFETDFEEVALNSNLQFEKIYENIPAGRYVIQVQDSLGCILELVDRVPLDIDLYVPNIITPNADAKNDVFFVRNLPVNEGKLTITDRWGVKVFSTTSYQNNWDGEGVEDGVYYYTLQTTKDTRKGWIEIKREVKP